MTLYKGRIDAAPNHLMDALNKSLPVDIRLFPYDVRTNRAWASALVGVGVYTPEECAKVHAALDEMEDMYARGAFSPLPDDEDVHTLTERLLTEKLGDLGARIHTGRSRNDQVACDLYQYVRDITTQLEDKIRDLVRVVVRQARLHADTVMAGTTHLQPAQPITLGHFLLSLAFALVRDAGRLADARRRADRCPLGSGAIAGCGFPVDREQVAKDLGFSAPTDNSIDTISDRDVAQETAFACAVLLSHLSRYAEQFVLWSNPAFGYVRWADTWSTGSSMMPQKRNPDAMELVRGKAARVIAASTGLLTLTKGVPLTYAKDLQEDKAALFDACDTAALTVEVFTAALDSAVFVPERMAQVLTADMLATDLADALVTCGVPFRKAHEKVARLVTELEQAGRDLLSLSPADLEARFPELAGTAPALDYAASVQRRACTGGTALPSVEKQIAALESWLY